MTVEITSRASATGRLEDVLASPWIAEGTAADLPRWAQQIAAESLRTVVVPDAVHLDQEAFTQATHSAYEVLLEGLEPESLARVWNFVPHINDSVGDGINRYMAFNAGRFAAYGRALDSRDQHPVASGVGHVGEDLVVHAIVGASAIDRISNARQHEPHAYTRNFGPQPPAFSRAAFATFQGERWFLVSGTASVVGEQSHHPGDARAQLAETIRNLHALLDEASEPIQYDHRAEWLVYLPDVEIADIVAAELAEACGATRDRLWMRQQALCRPELLVEIECAIPMGCAGPRE